MISNMVNQFILQQFVRRFNLKSDVELISGFDLDNHDDDDRHPTYTFNNICVKRLSNTSKGKHSWHDISQHSCFPLPCPAWTAIAEDEIFRIGVCVSIFTRQRKITTTCR
jgi:hypothetical protein